METESFLNIPLRDRYLPNRIGEVYSSRMKSGLFLFQLMEALSEVLSRVTPLRRGKDARASRACRLAADELLARAAGPAGAPGPAGPPGAPDPAAALALLEQALAKASEAVLRAPAPGAPQPIQCLMSDAVHQPTCCNSKADAI